MQTWTNLEMHCRNRVIHHDSSKTFYIFSVKLFFITYRDHWAVIHDSTAIFLLVICILTVFITVICNNSCKNYHIRTSIINYYDKEYFPIINSFVQRRKYPFLWLVRNVMIIINLSCYWFKRPVATSSVIARKFAFCRLSVVDTSQMALVVFYSITYIHVFINSWDIMSKAWNFKFTFIYFKFNFELHNMVKYNIFNIIRYLK